MKYLRAFFSQYGGSIPLTTRSLACLIGYSALTGLFFLPFLSSANSSSFTKQISYQAKLTDSTSATVPDGNYNMQFKLYNTLTGGSPIWTGTLIQNDRVAVASGQLSVMLGATSTSLTGVDFNQPLYLSVNIGGTTNTATPTWDGEMTPRKTIGTVPHSFNSDALDGLYSTAFVRTDATSTVATSSSQTLLTLNQLGSGDVLSLQGSNTAFLTVTNGGKVGIGTTSPSAQFSVVGNLFASTTATSTFQGGGINLITASGNTGCFAINGTCVGNVSGSQTPWSSNIDGGGFSLSNVNRASTTLLSTLNSLYVGRTATSTINGDNGISTLFSDLLVTGSTTLQNFTALNATTSNATTTNLYVSGTLAAVNFIQSNISTPGTLTVAGLSSLNGGASTTKLSVNNQFWAGGTGTTTITSAGWLGVGTSTPGSIFSVNSITNFTTATSTFYSSGGINLAGGCFAINGTCVSGSSGSQTPWNSNIDGAGFSLTNVNRASTTQLSVSNQFWAGGTGTTTITSAGWLGVGTSTPAFPLSVQGNALFSGNIYAANITATGTVTFSTLALSGVGTSMLIATDASGNLVSTSTPTAAYYTATSTTATSTFAGFIDVNGTGANATSTFASNLWVKGTLRAGTGSMYLNDLGLQSSDGNILLSRNSSSYLNGGNFGVGSSSPAARLSVQGNSIFSGNILAANITATGTLTVDGVNITGLSTFGGNASTTQITSSNSAYLATSGGNVSVGTTTSYAKLGVWGSDTSSNLKAFEVSNSASTTLFTITNAGNVGVGTTTPASAFSVQGSSLFSGNISLANLTATGTISGQSLSAQTLNLSTIGTSMLAAIDSSGNLISTSTPTAAYYLATSSIASIFPYASTTALTSSQSAYFATNSGSVGVGTTSPAFKFSVQGNALFSGNVSMANLIATGSISFVNLNISGIGTNMLLTTDASGNVVSSSTPTAAAYMATSTTATSTFLGNVQMGANADFLYQASTGTTTISNLSLGNMSFDDDAGAISWADMAVTNNSSAGTVESYTAQINGNPILTVYSESDGLGGIQNQRVGISTSTPSAGLTVWSATSSANATVFNVVDTASSTLFAVMNTGNAGVGTTSPASKFSVQGNGLFSGNISVANLTATGTVSFGSLVLTGLSSSMLIGTDASGNIVSTSTPTAAYYLATSSIASIFPYASTTGITSTGSSYFATLGGLVGIGTTSPTSKLSVQGGGLFSGNLSLASLFATGTINFSNLATSMLTSIDSSGNLVSTSTPTIAALSATSTTATSTFAGNVQFGNNADFFYQASTGTTTINNLNLGSLNFNTDAGAISWADMAVTSNSSAGTVESYTAQINGNPILTVYSEADGLGGIQNQRVGVSTSTPSAGLTVWSATSSTNSTVFNVVDTASSTLLAVMNNGNVGIGTTTPGSLFSINGVANFTTATSTFYSTGGINLAGGCFAVNGTCFAGTGGGGSTWTSDIDGAGYSLTNVNRASTTQLSVSNQFWAGGTGTTTITSVGWLGVGTSTPAFNLSVQGAGLFSGNISLASITATGTVTFSGLGTSMLVAINSSGNLVSTSTPTAAYYLATSSIASIFPYASTTAFTSSGSAYFAISGGNVGIGTTSPYAKLSVVGPVVAEYFSATSTTATSTFAGNVQFGNNSDFFYQASTGTTTINNLNLGSLNFNTDAGAISWADMAVTSNSSAGTVESYTAQINGNPILTVYSESDGLGGIQNQRVGISTSTPSAGLTVWSATSSANSTIFNVVDSASTTLLAVKNGNVGIGATTTPGTLFSINGLANFTTATTTFYSTGGINLAGGCFAISGTCVGSSGSGSGTVSSGTQGQLPFYDSAGTTLTATSSIFLAQSGFVGIGTTSPAYSLDVATTTRTANFIAQNITLSQSYGSIITAAVGSSTGYTNFSGGIGTGGADSVGGPFNNALRITNTGNLVNIASIQGGETLLTSAGTFAGRTDYSAGTAPTSLAVGDINGDGKADIATTDTNGATVSIFINRGNGTFLPAVLYGAGTSPAGAAINDLNGDGKADVAVANNGSDTVSVFINRGDGIFLAKVDYSTGSSPVFPALGDVNGDGKADMVVANAGADTVSVFINRGNGTFAPKVVYSTGTSPRTSVLADFNGDGRADIAVTDYTAATVSILLNRGDGTFLAKTDLTTGTNPYRMSAGDINGDGKEDLAIGNISSDTISVLLGNGDGTFATKVDYGTGSQPYGPSLADVNGDGKIDMVAVNGASGINTLSVLLNRGDGTFATKVDYATGAGPRGVALGDFNGDGKPDMVATASDDNTIGVFMNQPRSMFYANVSSGNVGIGTSTPTSTPQALFAKLTVWGANTSATGRAFNVVDSASSTLFTITNAGNVGIGTTTPGSLFSINGVANFTTATTSFSSTGGIDLAAGCFSIRGTCVTGGGSQTPWTSNIDGAGFNLTGVNKASTTQLSVSNQFWAGGTGTTTITSAGWLGVGTSTPAMPLSVQGNSLFSGNVSLASLTATGTIAFTGLGTSMVLTTDASGNLVSSSTPTAAAYYATSTTATSTFLGNVQMGANADFLYQASTGTTTISNLSLGNMSFDTDAGAISWADMAVTSNSSAGTVESYTAQINGNPILTVYSESDGLGGIQNQRVGISTSTPSAGLTVWSATSSANSTIFNVVDIASTTLFAVRNSGNVGIATTSPWRTLSISGTVGLSSSLTTTGITEDALCIDPTTFEVTRNSGATTCTVSSARFKHDIKDLDAGLAELSLLHPVSFKLNSNNTDHIGFVAEEVNSVDPRLVFYDPDGVTPRGVHYEELTALLARAVQELATTTDQIKIDVASIKASGGGGSGFSLQAVLDYLASFGVEIEQGIAYFKELVADKITTKSVWTNTLCIGQTCITEDQLKALLEKNGLNSGNSSSENNQTSADIEKPVIHLIGNATSSISIGDSYVDPGATVTDNVDHNLGVQVAGIVDTSVAGDYTLTYSAEDSAGNKAIELTRTVTVE